MKRLVNTMALACFLSSSVLAGEVPTVGSPAPVFGSQTQAFTQAPGDIPSVPATPQSGNDALSELLSILTTLVL